MQKNVRINLSSACNMFGGAAFMIHEMSSLVMWIISTSAIFLAVAVVFAYGGIARYWILVDKNSELFAPNGPLHDEGTAMLNTTMSLMDPYVNNATFSFSIISSLVLIAGLMQQQWYYALAALIVATVVEHAVIKTFLKSMPNYYKLMNIAEMETDNVKD